MNCVCITGRLVSAPEYRESGSGSKLARFTVAVDRGKTKEGVKITDFPNCVAYDKVAELVDKYCFKGMMVAVTGSIHTGKYEKDGKMVYFTEVAAQRVDFLSKREDEPGKDDVPVKGFSQIDPSSIPF